MIFAEPLWLWALLALPLLVAQESWAIRRDRERTARLVARPLWGRVVSRPAEGWRFLRLALLLVGAAGMVLALARPQWGIVREKLEREGVDVVLVLDTSGSMATEDVAPSRFFLARSAILALVSRLAGDRFGLLAFEGEAYPLVPLTLDADAVGLFLETLEPGAVPAPGSSLGLGLARGLEMFVDEGRRNKVMVLVSDGEDLEGETDAAVRGARQSGVIVHTVGVGTEQGEPVPDFDDQGRRVGFKKDDKGSAVVSRLHPETLEAIARGTGGTFFRVSATNSTLSDLAGLIEGMERRALAREYSYRRKERFQVPLGVGLASLTLGLLLPPPELKPRRRVARPVAARRVAALVLGLSLPASQGAAAETPRLIDEVLLRPRRATARGLQKYREGNHPGALESFESAAASRPEDPRTRFNLGAALYKNGRYDEAAALFGQLAADAASPLAGPSRFNLGNALFQQHKFPEAAQAYRDAHRLMPADEAVRRNLELALRQLQEQQRQQQQQQDTKQDQKQDSQPQSSPSPRPGNAPARPPSQEEQQRERFEREAGMPKERAMALLEALEENEKAEQKKLLAAERAKHKKKGKDW